MKPLTLIARGACTALLLLAVQLPFPSAQAAQDYKRTTERYTVPDVTLVDQNARRIRLLDLLNSDKPLVLDFIYGTCTTICPVLSANFTNFQHRLGSRSDGVQLVSISIDPEHDTPEVMTTYLKHYRAKPGWTFLTGSRADIDQVMRAFDAYVPNKMSHYPLIFLRAPHAAEWVRIYGMIGTGDFVQEYEKIARP